MTWVLLIKILLSGLVILILCLICGALLVAARKRLTVHADKEHVIQLGNGGNCRSQYQLTVSSPEKGLAFTLLKDQVPLVEIKDLVEPQPVMVASAEKAPAKTNIGTKTSAMPLQKVSNKFGSVASMLGSVGSLLPGRLGRQFGQQANQMRDLQASSSKMAYAPVRFNRKVKSIQPKGGAKSETPEVNVGQSGKVSTDAAAQVQLFQGSYYCAQTSELLPGEATSLNLRIGTRSKRYPIGSFMYTIKSEQFAIDLPDLEIPLVTKNGTVSFEPKEEWRYWLLPIANISLVLLTSVSIIFSLALLWQ